MTRKTPTRPRVNGLITVKRVTRTLSLEALDLMDRAGIEDQSHYISQLITTDCQQRILELEKGGPR